MQNFRHRVSFAGKLTRQNLQVIFMRKELQQLKSAKADSDPYFEDEQ